MVEFNFRPEEQLLILCARVKMDPKTAVDVKTLLQENLDYVYLLEIAYKHGMMPLLFWHLDSCCADAIPPWVMVKLRDQFHQNSRRNLLLTGELLKLLEAFHANNIPVIPFKGPVLTNLIYQNLALRQFRDLDLLCLQPDVPKAKELLISMGYQPQLHLTGGREEAFMKSQCELSFLKEDGSIVELHWGITPKYFAFPLDPESLWDRLEPVYLAGRKILALSIGNLLLTLCVHGAKHLWDRLEWICDISELIRACPDMKWREVVDRAAVLRSQRMLLLGLFIANDLLGASLPEEVSRKIEDDSVIIKELGHDIYDRLFQKPKDFLFDQSLFRPLHLKMRECWQDRINYCYRAMMVPTDADWESFPLPDSFSFFYYIIRPLRLVSKYFNKGVKHLLGRDGS